MTPTDTTTGRARGVSPVAPSGRRLPGPMGIVALFGGSLLCLAAAIGLAVMVHARWAALLDADLAVDTAIHTWVRDQQVILFWAKLQSWTGSPVAVAALTSLIVVGLLATRRPGPAAYLTATAVGGAVLSEVLKDVVARQRPVWLDPLWSAEGFSFPSGHSLAGITNWFVYGVLVLYLVAGRRGAVLGSALMAWGVLMAPSRLVLGVHWPSDVVAGWLLGFGWVAAVSAGALLLLRHREAAQAEPA